MSSQPCSLSDSKGMISSRLNSLNYEFPFPSSVSHHLNQKIFTLSSHTDQHKNIHNQSSQKDQSSRSNFLQANKNLQSNILSLSCYHAQNRVQQNKCAQPLRIKKNLPQNAKSNEMRIKSPDIKQNIPFYKKAMLDSYTSPDYQQKHTLKYKQNLTYRFSQNNNDSSLFKIDEYQSLCHQNIKKRNQNYFSQKDAVNQKSFHLDLEGMLKLPINQKDHSSTIINKSNQDNSNSEEKSSLAQSRIQKNSWHRKSKSIEFNNNNCGDMGSLESLKERIHFMENTIRESLSNLHQHSIKIQKLQLSSQQNQGVKNDQLYNLTLSQSLKRSVRHSSINNSSFNSNYRQLFDIMSIIEETKNVQIKNSDQYRKMIEQFRTTILQFKDELNRTVKKQEVNEELKRIRQMIGIMHLNTNKYQNQCQNKDCSNSSLNLMQKSLLEMKNAVNKLEDSNLSLKAEIVKFNVREKRGSEEMITKYENLDKKIITIQNSLSIFDEKYWKKSDKRSSAKAVCFSVSQHIAKQVFQLNNSSSQLNWHSYSALLQPNSHIKHSHNRSPSSNLPNSEHKYNYNSVEQVCFQENKIQNLKRIYYIDKSGYLLDKDNYYLLNAANEQIKLSEKEIGILKRLKVLEP